MLLKGSLLATIGYAQVQHDIYWTPPQVEALKAKGHNVDGLTVLVSLNLFVSFYRNYDFNVDFGERKTMLVIKFSQNLYSS